MSEIPYSFETPVPRYFRENGWFECEHMFKFVHWAFSKCQTIPHKIVKEGREILLQPYEFIAGRLSSPKECFLTENIFRNQRLKLEKAGLLKKSTNSLTNHFSCYIWVTEAFSKNDNQPNNQPSTNRQPTVNHKDRYIDTSKDVSKKKIAQPASQLRPKDPLFFNFEKWEFEGVTEKDIENWILMYPHIDIRVEILKASQWLRNNPSKSNKTLWRKYLTGWLGRANDSIENKKAYKHASSASSQDRRTKNVDGTPAESPHDGRF